MSRIDRGQWPDWSNFRPIPSAPYRAFETDGGISKHLLRRRLDLVRRDLATPSLGSLSVAQIAERRRLHKSAAFQRTFRLHVGETPGECRANAQAKRGRASSDKVPGRDEGLLEFIHLLRRET